ncbi:hypothetical protein IE077_003083 [Cardiosporidium cionae]|uniref:Uncharacterized protein n=1 Tax=Cardiosporidium cionae TaxID=476202 RepID=A0ABQ7J447_9APIC|nr:hypothetical protein IE077_003083 [Cardiosporidium cionae]|eukprot:KAF8817891.1 hypothetical protein IE077_003083 [Cardiosporidium cionae]
MRCHSLFAFVVLSWWTLPLQFENAASFKHNHVSQPLSYGFSPLLPLVSCYGLFHCRRHRRISRPNLSCLLLGGSLDPSQSSNSYASPNEKSVTNVCLIFLRDTQSGDIFCDALINLVSHTSDKNRVHVLLETRDTVEDIQEEAQAASFCQNASSIFSQTASSKVASLSTMKTETHLVRPSYKENQVTAHYPLKKTIPSPLGHTLLYAGVAFLSKNESEPDAPSRIPLKSLRDTMHLMHHFLPHIPTNKIAEKAITMIEVGMSHLKNQRFTDALHMFNSAIRSLPLKRGFLEAYLHVHSAYIYLMMKKYSQAMDHANQAREIAPMYGMAWQRMGEAFRCTRQFWKALQAYEIAHYLDKRNTMHLEPLKKILKKMLEESYKDLSEFKGNFLDIHSATVKLPLGFAIHGNTRSYGGCSIGYIIQESNADKKELIAVEYDFASPQV